MTREEAIWYVNHTFEVTKEELCNNGRFDEAKEFEIAQNMAIEALSAERTVWIPVSERLPEDLDEVNVTWVNHNPPVYYEHIMGKPNTGFAVLYDEKWYWWDSTIVDTLAEYGNQDFLEPIDKGIEIIAWMPMPEPYKGGDTE